MSMIIVTLVGDATDGGMIRVCSNQQDQEALACFLIDTVEHILRGMGEKGLRETYADGDQETVSTASEDPSGRTAEVGAGESDANAGHGDSHS